MEIILYIFVVIFFLLLIGLAYTLVKDFKEIVLGLVNMCKPQLFHPITWILTPIWLIGYGLEKVFGWDIIEKYSDTNTGNIDRTNWTGKNFEFLITGVNEIPDKEYDRIMTPNSFEWKKVIKDGWPFYVVGKDEFSFSWEIPGIQFTFNNEVEYEKAKKIADEIIENLNSIGQNAELLILESNKVYRFE